MDDGEEDLGEIFQLTRRQAQMDHSNRYLLMNIQSSRQAMKEALAMANTFKNNFSVVLHNHQGVDPQWKELRKTADEDLVETLRNIMNS